MTDRRACAHASTRNAHYCYVQLTSASATAVEVDIEVLDENGAVLLSVTGLRYPGVLHVRLREHSGVSPERAGCRSAGVVVSFTRPSCEPSHDGPSRSNRG